MKRLAVLNVVGLCGRDLAGMPFLRDWAAKHETASFKPAFPAVTCTAQSTYVTGKSVDEHGIVGNGWYDREAAEVKFWKQPDHFVKGEKLWETLRRENPEATCAKWFWWYNMYSSADYSMTPRPMYPADGRKFFDVYSHPMELREEVKKDLGDFPFPSFWGPRAGIDSSKWIAASAKWIEKREEPTLNLVYLPHLDYSLQKYGPGAPEVEPELHAIDEVLADLIPFLEKRDVEVVALSEYGISKVNRAVHLNRVFREQGWIMIKEELGLEQLDCGASEVFAVADHQVAHIYVKDRSLLEKVRQLVAETDGVAEVRDGWQGVGGERGGDLVAVAESDVWFSYYYWLDDAVAPDFARSIDIHRKPGYDPVELFIDPEIKFPKLKIAAFLAKKKLGLRGLLDVIPLDTSLVKGSHGRDEVGEEEQPVLIGKGVATVSKAREVHGYLCSRW
jgi:predicted AlkP superfamily pyrophosphatase or phosphodiesterase